VYGAGWQGHPEQSGSLFMTALLQKWHTTVVTGATTTANERRQPQVDTTMVLTILLECWGVYDAGWQGHSEQSGSLFHDGTVTKVAHDNGAGNNNYGKNSGAGHKLTLH
jgi:hypothetical protein